MSKYDWNLKDLFENKEEFYNAIKNIKQELKGFDKYKGKLSESADNIYECYNLYEKILLEFDKVYSYGMFSYHLNMAEQEGIKLFKEVESLSAELSMVTSFIVPEITFIDDEKINKYLEDNRLKRYERDIKDILDKNQHVLSKE